MAAAAEGTAPRSRLGPVALTAGANQALAVLAILVAWLVYVFAGSQFAYLAAAVISAALAAGLAWERRRLAPLVIVGQVVLLGSEASGRLAPGTAVLGAARLVDTTLAAALLALLVSEVVERRRAGRQAGVIRLSEGWRERASRAPGALVLAGLVLWAAAMWSVNGAPFDSILRTDLRVLALGVGTWVLAVACRRDPPRDLARVLALLALPVAAKAMGIRVSDLFVIGANDRLQASIIGSSGGHRVILIGGDTFLALTPALAVLALTRARAGLARGLLIGAMVAAFAGLLISSTRTGLLAAIILLAGVAAVATARRRGPGRPQLSLAVIAVAVTVVGAGAWTTGLFDRFIQADAPHSGINVRVDETKTFLDLPPRDVLLGQGLGGRFETISALNAPTVSGWSHVLPVWIGLKVGLLGLAAALAMLAVVARRAWALMRRGGPRRGPDAAVGLVFVGGLLLMSLTVGRAALPEGVPLLAFGLALLPQPARHAPL